MKTEITVNEMLESLKSISNDVEFRDSNPLFKKPYICGYHGGEDVSFRVCIGDKYDFYIEMKGHTVLNRSTPATKDAFMCFVYILGDMVKSLKTIRQQCYSFPNYTQTDNRDQLIKKILK